MLQELKFECKPWEEYMSNVEEHKKVIIFRPSGSPLEKRRMFLLPSGCSFSWLWAATLHISQHPPLHNYHSTAAGRFTIMHVYHPKPLKGCSLSQQDNKYYEEKMLQLKKAENRWNNSETGHTQQNTRYSC